MEHELPFITGSYMGSSLEACDCLSQRFFFFFFKYMAPAWVCFVFQLQCTLQTYCLIYFIFIKVISEVGMTLGPLL